jgi:GMP synthase (glutamine-hydrolysing)
MDANLVYVDAVDRFLDKLEGVAEPEKKRKIIGAEFIRACSRKRRASSRDSSSSRKARFTPDILESGPDKAHHTRRRSAR